MAQDVTVLRIVLASPGDVSGERQAFARLVNQVNRDTARPAGFQLDLWRWETDANPGFNPKGPQGLIDRVLRIADCDLFVGIFWNRIGTFTKNGKTGTEHEFSTAYRTWKKFSRPAIMFYFNEKPSTLTSESALEQRRRVIQFKEAFPSEGLYWPYKGQAEFVKYVNDHLRTFVKQHIALRVLFQDGRTAADLIRAHKSTRVKTFTLKVGPKGLVLFPAGLLKSLLIAEGDSLQLKVANNAVFSGAGLKQAFGLEPTDVLLKRINSSHTRLTTAQLRKATKDRGRNV